MATKRTTGKITKPKEPNKNDKNILEYLLAELDQEIDAKEGSNSYRITKGRALIKSMVNEALKGDQRMMANVLKFVEKLETLQDAKETQQAESLPVNWEMIFHFFGKYKEMIEIEIQKRRKENPGGWNFNGCNPMPLESVPWFKDLYGEKL
jgi:hypothetical protein